MRQGRSDRCVRSVEDLARTEKRQPGVGLCEQRASARESAACGLSRRIRRRARFSALISPAISTALATITLQACGPPAALIYGQWIGIGVGLYYPLCGQ